MEAVFFFAKVLSKIFIITYSSHKITEPTTKRET